LIGNWNDFEKAETERYFDFSEAYLKASIDICKRMMSSEQEYVWANASASMLNAAHSVELFLKGALLSSGIEARGHSIDDLYERYLATFRERGLSFQCPFVSEYLGLSEEQIEMIQKSRRDSHSVILRYPLNRPGLEWDGLYGFKPDSFFEEMADLLTTFKQLRLVHEP
jgi:HEPN domain-containing protein